MPPTETERKITSLKLDFKMWQSLCNVGREIYSSSPFTESKQVAVIVILNRDTDLPI